MKSNHVGLRLYLEKFGIDATKVPQESVSPEGYHVYREHADGRPIYKKGYQSGFVRDTEFREWPSELVYLNVCLLITGASDAELLKEVPPKAGEEPTPPKQATPPKEDAKPPAKK